MDARAYKDIARATFRIGADGGALWLLENNFTPDIAVGDFDSVTQTEKKHIHDYSRIYIEHAAEKDDTDLALAVDEAIALVPEVVRIYGALGTRFDHDMAAIGELLRLVSHNIYGEIVDNYNRITIVRRRQVKFSRNRQLRYLSVVPLTERAIVTLRGVKFPITKKQLHRNSTLGISNEIRAAAATIRVHSGTVAVIRSQDAAG